jgi:hypothetical protein
VSAGRIDNREQIEGREGIREFVHGDSEVLMNGNQSGWFS